MDPGTMTIARLLHIDVLRLSEVLLCLRRDHAGEPIRWTLGDHGTAEIDANITTDGLCWHTNGRVWDARHLAVCAVDLRLMSVCADEVAATLRPHSALPSTWRRHPEEFQGVARATLDEFSEELLWQARHPGVTADH